MSSYSKTVWYHALTLEERFTNLPSTVPTSMRDSFRMKKWKNVLERERLLEQKLTELHIDIDTLVFLADEPIESLEERIGNESKTPNELASLLEIRNSATAIDFSFFVANELYHLVEHLYKRDFERLHDFTQNFMAENTDVFDPNTIHQMLLGPFLYMLNSTIARVFILELNILRLRNQLVGDTPAERYLHFIKLMENTDRINDLLQRYPVLTRQIVTLSKQYVANTIEWITRLGNDWHDIWATLLPGKHPSRLIGVTTGAGDPHNNGHSVSILTFEGDHRIVYKPRNLDVDVHFQDLLSWFNTRLQRLHFYTLKILPQPEYGWIEFIPYKECQNHEEVEYFYESQGAYLAILHLLEASDFHSENIIAFGKYPVLVDVEALFHPRFKLQKDSEDYNPPVFDAWAYSVLRTGLLPVNTLQNNQEPGFDISGLGTPQGQLTPIAIPQISSGGTDVLKVVRERVALPDSSHRPVVDGEAADVVKHIDTIINGFSEMYRLLLELRSQLVSDQSPLLKFRHDRIRVILRATQTYATLLYESNHPDVLQNALDRDRLYDHLWYGAVNQRYLARCVQSEQRSLHRGDIPVFYTTPVARDLQDSDGHVISSIIPRCSFDIVVERARSLSEEDLERQTTFIRGSVLTLTHEFHTMHEPRIPGKPHHIHATTQTLLEAAIAVAERLEVLAIQDDVTASWIGLTFINERSAVLQPLDIDLYSGLPGIILFLSYTDLFVPSFKRKMLIDKCLKSIEIILKQKENEITYIGLFGGWGSVLYLYAHLAVMRDDNSYIDKAVEIVKRLGPLIELDDQLDVINGAAGCIMALDCLTKMSDDPVIVDTIRLCANHLISTAKQVDHGIGWVIPGFGANPMAGMSHGSSGFALALACAANHTGNNEYREYAHQTIAYERSLYSDEVNNWLDVREFEFLPKMDTTLVAWCHGAAGIGLGRLALWQYLPEERSIFSGEIDTAVRTTLQTPFASANHSLCHGSLGNLELVIEARRLFGTSQLDDALDQIPGVILDSIEKNGWLSGGPGSLEIPGFMVGLAGIGYGLLRLAYPAIVPSILMLEGPYQRNTIA